MLGDLTDDEGTLAKLEDYDLLLIWLMNNIKEQSPYTLF